MTAEERKALAKMVQGKLDVLLDDFRAVLSKHGIEGVKVISFSLAPSTEARKHLAFGGSPCPTKCVVLPDGRVECKPVC